MRLPQGDADLEDGSNVEEPSSKRRRLDEPKSRPISVCEGFVTCSRRPGNGPSVSMHRSNIGEHLGLRYLPQTRAWQFRDPRYSAVHSTFSVKEEHMSQNWRILRETARLRRSAKPGEVWTTVSVDINRSQRATTITFIVRLYWNPVSLPFHRFASKSHRETTALLLDEIFPHNNPSHGAQEWSPMDFYDAVHVPAKDDNEPESIEIPQLEATLYPFQKRAVQWALRREGVEWSRSARSIANVPTRPTPTTTSLFRRVKDANGQDLLVSDVLQIATRDITAFARAEAAVTGGILAEEMGLGKTLEVISLMLLHRKEVSPRDLVTHEEHLTPSGATLIITPPSLRRQWLAELAKHAPALRVYNYQGCKNLTQKEYASSVQQLAGCDVVVTTYSVLSAEVHFAVAPPERSRRHERKYERKESPLVKVSWWRLCLDEAQMIENGFSQAAQVARAIPRHNAWAITGTPVKDGVQDLFGLLIFLRYEPFCSYLQLRQAMTSGRKEPFQRLFNSIALRHTKALVRDQLKLPPQKRYVISIPFTPVEEQLYQSLYREMANACGLDEEGGPLLPEWNPDNHVEDMRTWLNRLRQTALHPEVGAQNRRALGSNKARPLRTVDEVLDAMLDQSDTALKADERAYLSSKLSRGQLFENSPRVREALEIWLEVREEVRTLVNDARSDLRQAIEESRAIGDKSLDHSMVEVDYDTSDDEFEDVENKGRIGESRRRLRFALEMLHKAVFFCANAYFQIRDNPEMTDPESEEYARLKNLEDQGYEEAKVLRREILKQSHRRATRLMNELSAKADAQDFTEIPELTVRSERGIESSRIVDDLERLYGRLNEQANVIDEWREHLVQLLLKPLLDEEDEAEFTGEELADSTKLQDELIVYVTALRAAIADRDNAITGQDSNERIKHETLTSIKLAKDGNGPAPEKLLELLEVRARINPRVEGFSMRSALSQLRTLTVLYNRTFENATQRTVLEHKIAGLQLESTQRLMKHQTKAAVSLEAEVEDFRTAMNARVEFYRQLQAVSDSVLPYEGPKGEMTALIMQKTEGDLVKKLAQGRAKHRYRRYLALSIICIADICVISAQPEGCRQQIIGAKNVCHLPVVLHYWSPHSLRTSVL